MFLILFLILILFSLSDNIKTSRRHWRYYRWIKSINLRKKKSSANKDHKWGERSSIVHDACQVYFIFQEKSGKSAVDKMGKSMVRNLLRPNCLTWNEVAKDRVRSWTIKFERWLADKSTISGNWFWHYNINQLLAFYHKFHHLPYLFFRYFTNYIFLRDINIKLLLVMTIIWR